MMGRDIISHGDAQVTDDPQDEAKLPINATQTLQNLFQRLSFSLSLKYTTNRSVPGRRNPEFNFFVCF